MLTDRAVRTLHYGDNIEILRNHVADESVDLCYIDPPFHSNRNYNQIYTSDHEEKRTEVQAFVDIWRWDERAIQGYDEILANASGLLPWQVIALIKGFRAVLGMSGLLAYLVNLALRIGEIHRVLKLTGSHYVHCDPAASHYIKLVLDAVFVPKGGEFQNEIIWNYATGGASKRRFARKHDVLFYYTKSKQYTFNADAIREPRTEKSLLRAKNPQGARISSENTTKLPTDVFQIPALNPMSGERLGYPTQKPEELLERIILASSNENDVVLDAYCGCGTTIAVAERKKRRWIGIDITYASIELTLRRLNAQLGPSVLEVIRLSGIPEDIESARILASRNDDRIQGEFEKWVQLRALLSRLKR